MTCKNIRKKTDELKNYGITDPFLMCRFLKIVLNYHSFGNESDSIKGLYTRIAGVNIITLNADISDNLKKVILWHEIGHAVLHTRKTNFAELSIYSESDKYETEANLFASDMMFDDEEVLSLIDGKRTLEVIATELDSPCEMLDFKLRMMKECGREFIAPPMTTKNNFLKDVKYK